MRAYEKGVKLGGNKLGPLHYPPTGTFVTLEVSSFWIYKSWYMQTMEYYIAMEIKEL